MSDKSKIEWTEATWNPITGCSKVSPGCAHCYAETFAERFRGVPGHPYQQGFDLKLWPERLRLPHLWREPRRIFVNSMSDIFHEDVPTDFVLKVFETMRQASHHEFQVLTKRSSRLRQLASQINWSDNIWMGVSVENQRWADRIDDLRATPAAVKFLSCEPLLGPLRLNLKGIDWVIVGGESGPHARRMRSGWACSIRDQCRDAGVPFFFKQWGTFDVYGKSVGKKAAGRELDCKTWDEFPAGKKSLVAMAKESQDAVAV